MEIAPIAGIRVQPVQKRPPATPGLTGVSDIALSRAGDDTYAGSGGKSRGGQDDASEQDELLDDGGEDSANSAGGISLFA